jgi:hypothetical protein
VTFTVDLPETMVLICFASLSSGRWRRRFEATASRGSLKLPPAPPGFSRPSGAVRVP